MRKRVKAWVSLLLCTAFLACLYAPPGYAESYAICDTTVSFALARGGVYTFKITVSGDNQAPSFTVGNGAVLKTHASLQRGNEYYFQVLAVGATGQSTGVYTTLPGQSPVRHCEVFIDQKPAPASTDSPPVYSPVTDPVSSSPAPAPETKRDLFETTLSSSDMETESGDTVIDSDTALGSTSETYPFAGIYKYNGDLTIEEDTALTSSGISQLVLLVDGTLTLKEGAAIRVRNGYYPKAPENEIADMTESKLAKTGENAGSFNLYPGLYGKGGDGGNGGSGSSGTYPGSGGNGGGNGYGGGRYGKGGAKGSGSNANLASKGREGPYTSAFGGAEGVGNNAYYPGHDGNGGDGGGGNGGNGAPGRGGVVSRGGNGGGGGGYGGGVLTIVARKIRVESDDPVFLVSGQVGGLAGQGGSQMNLGSDGEDGEGGMLVILCPDYTKKSAHYTVKDRVNYPATTAKTIKVENKALEGGHGNVIGGPQKVFVLTEPPAASGAGTGSSSSATGGVSSSVSSQPSEPVGTPLPTPSDGGVESLPDCQICNNSGKMTCPRCNGTGTIRTGDFGIGGGIKPSAGGLGYTDGGIVDKPCDYRGCNGNGWIPCPCGRSPY